MADVPIRVVIVDDDESHRQLLSEELADPQPEGPRFELVGEASDGATGVQMVLEHRPDVVVMDIEMPYLDGIEATAELRERAPDIPVVILSSHSESVSLRKALVAGARDYLVKGREAGQLLTTLDEAVQLARRRASAFQAEPSGLPGAGIWSFLRSAGGSGQTTLLLALANELAAAGKRVLVLDLNLPFTHFPIYLRLSPEAGDLSPLLSQPATRSLSEVAFDHPSGILVLRPPSNASAAARIHPAQLVHLATSSLAIADYVLVDHPAGLPAPILQVLDQSRLVVPVGHDGMTGLVGLRNLLELLNKAKIDPTRTRPVISGPSAALRRDTRSLGALHGLAMDQVESFPHDPEACEVALTLGQPVTRVTPQSDLSRAIRNFLVPILGGAPETPAVDPDLGDLMTRLLKDL